MHNLQPITFTLETQQISRLDTTCVSYYCGFVGYNIVRQCNSLDLDLPLARSIHKTQNGTIVLASTGFL